MDQETATIDSRGSATGLTDIDRSRLVLVVVPCLNEEATIARVVEGIPKAIDGADRVEVLVIDDGSSDDTAVRARAAGAEVLSHASNMGLGWTFSHAVRTALLKGAAVMVNIDGDGQFDPGDVPTLVAPVSGWLLPAVIYWSLVTKKIRPYRRTWSVWNQQSPLFSSAPWIDNRAGWCDSPERQNSRNTGDLSAWSSRTRTCRSTC